MKTRDERLTLVLTRQERDAIEGLQRQLAERGNKASLSSIAVALVRQALKRHTEGAAS